MSYCNDAAEIPAGIMRTLQARLPGATKDMVQLELFNVAAEFFSRSKAWQARIVTPTYEGVRTVVVPLPLNSEPATIAYVSVDGRELRPVAGDHHADPALLGAACYVPDDALTTLQLYPTPTLTDSTGLVVVYLLRPPTAAMLPYIPPAIASRYQQALIDGTMAEMSSHVGKPYSNSKMVTWYRDRFLAQIARARRDVMTRNAVADPAWNYPQIAPGTGGRRHGGV